MFKNYKISFSAKLIVLGLVLITSPFLKIDDENSQSVLAASACLTSIGSYNYPGPCEFIFSYADLPGVTTGVDNAGLSQCLWSVRSLDGNNNWMITRTMPVSSCGPGPVFETIHINIGPNNDCRQTGINTCFVSVWSIDKALPVGTVSQKDFYLNIQLDSTAPQVGNIYITSSQSQQAYPIMVQKNVSYTYKADVSDNIGVSTCDFYLGGSYNGSMTVPANCGASGCVVSKTLTLSSVANYPDSYAVCYDTGNNQGSGPGAEIRVVDANVALTAIPTSGNTVTRFSLKADVTGGMTGNVDYKFDCTNNGTWDEQASNVSSDTYTATDLCQYSVGTHIAKVYIEKGLGTATATVSIPVVANDPPVASFSCDASLCGPGSSSSSCIGYQGCIISAENLSSDINGLDDIESVVWVVKDSATMQTKDQLVCPSNNLLCNYALPSTLFPKLYEVTITVSDLAGQARSYSRNIQLRRDISVDFVCSDVDPAINNTKWKACDDPSFKPAKDSRVYFHDNLSDGLLNTLGLNGRKSILSEAATKFTKKIWKKDGVSFNTCQSSSGCTNSNPSSIIEGTEITLEIEDDSGRTGEADSEITTQASLPEWEEIAPF
jgi:hypothetical protein